MKYKLHIRNPDVDNYLIVLNESILRGPKGGGRGI